MTTSYTANGYPYRLTRASDGTVYATIDTMDAFGHATLVAEGNGVTLTRGYDAATGLAVSTLASGSHGTVAHLTTAWDGFGNLQSRSDARNNSTETASYDKLNRLTGTVLELQGGGGLIESYTYDDTGNRVRVSRPRVRKGNRVGASPVFRQNRPLSRPRFVKDRQKFILLAPILFASYSFPSPIPPSGQVKPRTLNSPIGIRVVIFASRYRRM